MTRREKVLRVLPQITAAVTVLLVVAICVSFAIVIPLSGKVAEQAAAGAAAKNRSCALIPIARKIYGDFETRDVITAQDYRTVFGTAVDVCGTQK